MQARKERIYMAVTAIAVVTAAFLGVMLWNESQEDPRLILSVGEDGMSVSTDDRR